MTHILKCLKNCRNIREGSKSRPGPKIYNDWARDGTGHERDMSVPGLSGICVPKFRDLLSRGILAWGLSRRCLSRSRLSRGSESRSQSRGFAGPGSRQIPGQPPIPGLGYFFPISNIVFFQNCEFFLLFCLENLIFL